MNGGYGFQPNLTVRALLPAPPGMYAAGLVEQLARSMCPVPVPLVKGSLVEGWLVQGWLVQGGDSHLAR